MTVALGIAGIQARIDQLDRQIRTFDPGWAGATGAAPSFETIFDPAAQPTGDDLLAGVTTTAPDTTASGLPAGWGAALSSSKTIVPAATHVARTTVDADSRVVAPVRGARISQDFGPTAFTGEPSATVDGVTYAHYHDGTDYAAPLGRPVRAIAAGEVVGAGRAADGAVIVRIRHSDGSESLYGHLQPDLDVRKGDHVAAGDQIGAIGMTGHTTGPHLHLELTRNGRKLDPERVIAAGILPGAKRTASAASAEPAPPADGPDALARFDAIAAKIPYAKEIRAAAVKAGIDPLLLTSMVRAESGFRANAVSSAGAQGLGQLMPATSRSMGVTNPFDPATNVAAAARYLANNLRIYGRVDLALAAYQAGKGAVARAGGIPDSPTTHHYIDRILGYWSGYLEAAA